MKTFAVSLMLVLLVTPRILIAAESTSSATSLSTFSKSPTTSKSSQSAYKIKNDGTSKNSRVVEYDHRPSFAVYQDEDLDGNFGERERAGQDLDGDGVRGESEDQVGEETVNQKQKITVLNNMGFSKTLSDFKAAGQIKRASIYGDEKDGKKSENASDFLQTEHDSNAASQTSKATSTSTSVSTKKDKADVKSRVLVA